MRPTTTPAPPRAANANSSTLVPKCSLRAIERERMKIRQDIRRRKLQTKAPFKIALHSHTKKQFELNFTRGCHIEITENGHTRPNGSGQTTTRFAHSKTRTPHTQHTQHTHHAHNTHNIPNKSHERIGARQRAVNKHRKQPKRSAGVLLVNQNGHAWPDGGGHKRKRHSNHQHGGNGCELSETHNEERGH